MLKKIQKKIKKGAYDQNFVDITEQKKNKKSKKNLKNIKSPIKDVERNNNQEQDLR